MAAKIGSLNRDLNGSLAVGTNDALFIQLPPVPNKVVKIWHINWGYSFLVTPIPTVAADMTYGTLKIIRNQDFQSTQNYTDAFGSTAAQFEMYYQDVIVGPTPKSNVIDLSKRPIETNVSESVLIVVSAPLSSFAGSFGAHLTVLGDYASPEGSGVYFPYSFR